MSLPALQCMSSAETDTIVSCRVVGNTNCFGQKRKKKAKKELETMVESYQKM